MIEREFVKLQISNLSKENSKKSILKLEEKAVIVNSVER